MEFASCYARLLVLGLWVVWSPWVVPLVGLVHMPWLWAFLFCYLWFPLPGLWVGFGLSLLPGVWAWVSLVGLHVGPVCGVWFDVGGLLCSGCCLPLLLGGKAFAFFPVFPSFGGACPAGLGYLVVFVSG